jgi:hypothetical protein
VNWRIEREKRTREWTRAWYYGKDETGTGKNKEVLGMNRTVMGERAVIGREEEEKSAQSKSKQALYTRSCQCG